MGSGGGGGVGEAGGGSRSAAGGASGASASSVGASSGGATPTQNVLGVRLADCATSGPEDVSFLLIGTPPPNWENVHFCLKLIKRSLF